MTERPGCPDDESGQEPVVGIGVEVSQHSGSNGSDGGGSDGGGSDGDGSDGGGSDGDGSDGGDSDGGDSDGGGSDGDDSDGSASTRVPIGRLPYVAFAVSMVALALSIYLTITHLRPAALVCTTKPFSVFGLFKLPINCAQVTTSKYSKILGIPVAYLGLAYYLVISTVNFPTVWRIADVRIAWARLVLTVMGMGMVFYLISAELVLIKPHAICEYCTGVHICTFTLFAMIVISFQNVRQRILWVSSGGDWGDDDLVEEASEDDAGGGSGIAAGGDSGAT